PDLPPPVFPIQAPPPKPPQPAKPKPPPPKPVQRPQPPAAPVEAAPQPAAPKTVSVAQVGFLVPPSPTYPASSRRSGEQGVATVRVLVDITGRPAQVSLQASSGHAALDGSALAAIRAAHFRPYAEGGIPQAVWVVIPVKFVLQ
ncbi:MAG: energy transducer TonB, partial [Reyranellales bacterium]